MTQCKIVAVAKTSYELTDLTAFGMDYIMDNQAYKAEKQFPSREDAKTYLQGRAIFYREEVQEKSLENMFEQIESGYLRLGEVTAFIR